MRVYLILALLLAILVTVFAIQNNAQIEVTFLFWKIDGSLALVLMTTLAIGIIIGILVYIPSAVRRRLQVGGLKRQLRTLEQAEALKPQAAPEIRPLDPTRETESQKQPDAGQQ